MRYAAPMLALAATAFAGANLASAHVVVKPSSAGIASFQTFSMGVPVEKDVPTTSMRLLIPAGLQSVTPTVKPGWTIDVKTTGDGESPTVTEIDWTGGTIPPGQRDDFTFSAQVPATAVTLQWKAYQAYSDGSTVSWDQDPALAKSADDDSLTPYSKTAVVNDLATAAAPTAGDLDTVRRTATLSLAAGAAGTVLGLVSLANSLGRRRR